jgi:putative hydrolase of the HAD superfamily
MVVIVGTSIAVFHQKMCDTLNVSKQEFITAYLNHNLVFNEGKIAKDEFWKQVLKDLNREEQFDEVMKVINKPYDLNMNVIEIIKDLKSNNYKLGILSNDTLDGASKMRDQEHLDELFDLILVSAETGLAKPTPEAFMDFVKKMDVKPNEIIFIDDAVKNIEAAKNLGIDGILCTDPNLLHDQLKDLNIL